VSTPRPWLASYDDGVPADVDVDATVTHDIERAAREYPARVATDFLGAVTTYRDLHHAVQRAAGALVELGIQPGDRVAVALPNCPTHVVLVHAILRIGAVVVETNPTYSAHELGHQLTDAQVSVALVWQKSVARTLEGAAGVRVVAVDLAADLPTAKRLALHLPIGRARAMRQSMRSRVPSSVPHWHHLLDRARPLPADHPHPELDDPALLQYTGGTTGVPKGAVLTHRNIAVNARQGMAWTQHRRGEETILAALPFFHAFGMTLCLTYSMGLAATLVIVPRFDVDMVLAGQARRPITFIPGVPPMFDRLTAAAVERGIDLRSVRHAISGAMSLPPATARAWEEATGGILVEGYGMTETSPVSLGSPMSPARRPGVLGIPFPSTWARIADLDDPTREAAPGERGELLVSGPQVFAGYWQRPEETAAVLLDLDGRTWLRTGDVVVAEEGGFFRLVDRIKEVIITGGFNVYPSQVEEHLRRMPEIADVAVVGLPGGDLGERVVAAIVLAEGVTRVELSAVRAWSENALARYAHPRDLVVLAELPRNAIGKVLRRSVREQLLDAVHRVRSGEPPHAPGAGA
jgi:long-chain acyl-CoA synthetase